MKSKRPNFLWIHYVYASAIVVMLIATLLLRPSMMYAVTIAAVTLVVAASSFIHYKHRDMRRDTLMEYLLVTIAVILVLLSATR
ncbi:hypothetical protein KW789_02860 [Candidatus Saccharibacteria bacterium]|jgi:hypothetical protein|nr:hypothetical protein [Candidatus Saccharibacteria bacterium]